MRYRNFSVIALVAILATLPGCWGRGDRPDLGYVRGVVTLDGKPVAGAGLSFQSDGFRSSLGRTDENGRYELFYLRDIKGAVVGEHLVRIDRFSTEDEFTPVEHLPTRYNDKTELIREVQAGNNVFDFELKSGE